jgi:hypothetical protein
MIIVMMAIHLGYYYESQALQFFGYAAAGYFIASFFVLREKLKINQNVNLLEEGKIMGKLLIETDIKREPNKLYYCATDKKGNITVWEADMKRGGKAKKKK